MAIELLRDIDPPADVVKRLQQVDPHLGLKFVEFAVDQEGNKPRWWAVVWEWPKGDKRRIQLGEHAAYDVLGYLPLDCSADQAFPYFENFIKGGAGESRKLVERIGEYNRDMTREAMKQVNERATELFEANATKLFEKETGRTVPKVFQSGK